MALIGQLEVGVRANTANFVKGMDESKRKTDSFLGSLSGLKVVAIGAIGALTAGFTIAALRRVSKSITLQKKFADQIGISFEALQELQFAAEQSGATIGALNASLRGMQRGLVLALNEAGPTAVALKAIGLSARELLQLSVDQQFLKIAKALKTWEGQTGQNIIAQQIFGATSKEIIALLRMQSGELDTITQQFEEMNIKISDIDAEKILEADKAVSLLRQQLEKTSEVLVSKLAPFVTFTINKFIDFQKARPAIDLVNVGLDVMATLISKVGAGVSFVQGGFQFVASVIEIVIAKTSQLLAVVAKFAGETLDIKALEKFGNTAEFFGDALELEAGQAFDDSLKSFKTGIDRIMSDAFGKKVVDDAVAFIKKIDDEANMRAQKRLDQQALAVEKAQEPEQIEKLADLVKALRSSSKRVRDQDIGQFQEINTSLVDVAALGRTGQRIENKQLDEQKRANKLLAGINDKIGVNVAVTAP